MHGDTLVRARWRLAEVKAFADERQLINKGAISAFYPMAFCHPPRWSDPCQGCNPRTGATEKNRCLANSGRGEAFRLFPALNARRLAVVIQVGEAGRKLGVIPYWGVQTIQCPLRAWLRSSERIGWKSRKVCSTSLAWGASDLARGGTEGVTPFGLRPKMAHRE